MADNIDISELGIGCKDCDGVFLNRYERDKHRSATHQSTTKVNFVKNSFTWEFIKTIDNDGNSKFSCLCSLRFDSADDLRKHARYCKSEMPLVDNASQCQEKLHPQQEAMLAAVMELKKCQENDISLARNNFVVETDTLGTRADYSPWLKETRWLELFDNVDLKYAKSLAEYPNRKHSDDRILVILIGKIERRLKEKRDKMYHESDTLMFWLGVYLL